MTKPTVPVHLVPAPQVARVLRPDPEVVYEGERWEENWLAYHDAWDTCARTEAQTPGAMLRAIRTNWSAMMHTRDGVPSTHFRLYVLDTGAGHRDWRWCCTVRWRGAGPELLTWNPAFVDAMTNPSPPPPAPVETRARMPGGIFFTDNLTF